jgi:NAD(P)H dehydrogenase (quinone)
VPSTILRCGLYSDFILDYWLAPSHASGVLMLPAGQGMMAPISRDDVAAAIAAVAARPDKSRATYTITGHRALSFDKIATAYGEATGQPLRYHPCSVDEYMAQASGLLDDPWPHAFSTLCASIAEGRYGEVPSDFAEITGREPEGFPDFLVRARAGSGQIA